MSQTPFLTLFLSWNGLLADIVARCMDSKSARSLISHVIHFARKPMVATSPRRLPCPSYEWEEGAGLNVDPFVPSAFTLSRAVVVCCLPKLRAFIGPANSSFGSPILGRVSRSCEGTGHGRSEGVAGLRWSLGFSGAQRNPSRWQRGELDTRNPVRM